MRRPALRSARSRLRNFFRAHPHIFSTGLRSGDFAGNAYNLRVDSKADRRQNCNLTQWKFGALSPCKDSGPKKNMSDFGRKAVNMCCSRRLADALKQRHGHCMHCPPAMCGGHALERHNASAYFFDICAYDICADVPIAPMVNPYSTCSYRVHVICAERAMNFCPCPTRHQFSHKPLST